MVLRQFTKSKEGVEQYQKLGLKYEDNLQDELYETWLKETTADNLAEFTHRKEKEITSIHVKQVSTHEYDDNGKEMFDYYVVWDSRHTRVDLAGNPVSRYLPNQGTYPIPRPHYKLGAVEFGKTRREIDYVENVDTGYTVKWTKDELLKLIKEIPLTKEGKGPSVLSKIIRCSSNERSITSLLHNGLVVVSAVAAAAERAISLSSGLLLYGLESGSKIHRCNSKVRSFGEQPTSTCYTSFVVLDFGVGLRSLGS